MPFKLPSKLRALLALALLSVPAGEESALDLNLGIAPSKSMLGLSYVVDKNQFNVGLNGFWINSSRGYWLLPALGYNRYLTENGFYGSLVYAPEYRNEEVSVARFIGPGPNDYVVEKRREKGWEPGIIFLGGGKSFQFTHWGVHVDAHLVTPADELARDWGYSIGAGGSYRFRLD